MLSESSAPNSSDFDRLSVPSGMTFGIAHTQWNRAMVAPLMTQVRQTLKKHTVLSEELCVPGALELVYAAKKMVLSQKYHCIIILGVVIRGDTYHFNYVCDGVSRGISCLNADLKATTPIVQGLITADTPSQVYDRILRNKGVEFAFSALQMTLI